VLKTVQWRYYATSSAFLRFPKPIVSFSSARQLVLCVA
jgi:hypothetical protein